MTRTFATIAALAVLAGCATAAVKPKVEIDKLKAKVVPGEKGWLIAVEYEVELEKYHGPPVALSLQISDFGRILLERDDQPFEVLVPLSQPSKVDGDELKFEGCVTIPAPAGPPLDCRKLRVHAAVVAENNGVLDAKDTRVKDYSPPGHRRHIGLGVGVGVGIGPVSIGPSIGF